MKVPELGVFFIGSALSLLMVVLTTALYYEIMRLISLWMTQKKRHPRYLMVFIVVMLVFGHTLCVWVYGILYWFLDQFGFGALKGLHDDSMLSFIYFSASTYSSLGFGDIFPLGPLRLITGVEVLNGLLLIGWSVTFTYLMMQKLWDFHPSEKKGRKS